MSAGATRIIAPAAIRHTACQLVPRNADGIKASEARKSMRTGRITMFRSTMMTNVGISAGWRSGCFIGT